MRTCELKGFRRARKGVKLRVGLGLGLGWMVGFFLQWRRRFERGDIVYFYGGGEGCRGEF